MASLNKKCFKDQKSCTRAEGGGGGMRRGAEKECTYEDERELVGGGEVQS